MSTIQNMEKKSDFRSVLESFMGKTKNEDELEGRNKIKTYLIESNFPEISSQSLRGIFELQDTNDDSLKILKSRVGNKYLKFYLDIADNRFWKLYSLTDSATTERFVRKLVEANFSKLDYL